MLPLSKNTIFIQYLIWKQFINNNENNDKNTQIISISIEGECVDSNTITVITNNRVLASNANH